MGWFKWHDGTTTDPKLGLVAMLAGEPKHLVIAVWAAILESAHQTASDGDFTIDAEQIAYMLDSNVTSVTSVTEAMETRGLLDGGVVANWGKRQNRDSTNAERQARHREKQAAAKACEALGETKATDEKPLQTPVTARNALRNTEETRLERKKEPPKAPQGAALKFDEEFDLIWPKFPSRGEAANPEKPARQKYHTARKAGATAEEILAGVERLNAEHRGKSGEERQFVPMARTWLHQAGWKQAATPSGEFSPKPMIAKLDGWMKGDRWPSLYGPPPGHPEFQCDPADIQRLLGNKFAKGRVQSRVDVVKALGGQQGQKDPTGYMGSSKGRGGAVKSLADCLTGIPN